ncbi:hypothetical protein IMG5_142740, partial [Ichthyophthirius multifiliis]
QLKTKKKPLIKMMCGGHQDKEITQGDKDLVQHHLNDINQLLGKSYTGLQVNSVQQQVVAGTNYTFVLTTNEGNKIEVRVFKPLPHTNQPTSVTYAKDV